MTDQSQRLEVATVKAEVGSNILYRFANDPAANAEIPTEAGDIPNLKQVILQLQEDGAEKISFATTIYPTAAAGLAATTDGGIFLVQSSDADTIYTVWKNNAGAAENTGKTAMSSQAIQDALTASNEAAQAAEDAADVATTRTAGFLQPAAEAPVVRDDGLPLQTGDRYFNTEDQVEYLYKSTGWQANDSLDAIAEIKDPTDESKGASLIPYDGTNLGEQLLVSRKLKSYADLRAYSGDATRFEITGKGISGSFYVDGSDTTTADNGCTVIVDANSRRIKRDFSGPILLDWCGPNKDGVTSDLPAFTKAASLAGPNDRAGGVIIGKGSYLLPSAVPTPTRWILEAGALIAGSPLIDDLAQDTAFLTGTIVNMNPGGFNTLRVGASDPWLSKLIRNATDSFAELVVAGRGRIGGLFYSRTSDASAPDMSCIGVSAFGVNDNTVNPEPAWANYMEAVRFPGTGPTFNGEWDMINLGNTYDMHPYSPVTAYGAIQAATANLWLSCGGGTSGLSTDANDASAAIGILPNGKKFRRGIVFRSGSLDSSLNEAVAMYGGNKLAWYDAAGLRNSYIDGGIVDLKRVGDSDDFSVFHISRKRRSGTGTSLGLDRIHTSRAYGYDGSADYMGTEVVSLQRTAFDSGVARFSYDIAARNSAGSFVGVTLHGSGNNTWASKANLDLDLGSPSCLWNVVRAGTATINTSDMHAKQQIAGIPDDVLDAWAKVDYQQYKLNTSVQEKGETARLHVGVIAQQVQDAFESSGIDPFSYGLLCHDEWDEQPEILGSDGEVVQAYRPAGSLYGIRYEEALVLEAALMRRATKRLEDRLSALELK